MQLAAAFQFCLLGLSDWDFAGLKTIPQILGELDPLVGSQVTEVKRWRCHRQYEGCSES